MPIEIIDFAKQKYKLYIADDVANELELKMSRNFSSSDVIQKERAEVLFRHLNRTLYNIANGVLIDASNINCNGELIVDVFEEICTIIATPSTNDSRELGFIVTRIIWKYMSNPWWAIVEKK